MRKPILVYTSPKGATVHSYDLEGGKRTFERYLGVTWDRVSFITP